MRKMWLFSAILCITLLISPVTRAGVTWNCAADGDGAIETGELGPSNWAEKPAEEGIPAFELAFDAVQNWGPAHMEGDFVVDGDPIVYLLEDVDNQTGFAWTGYEFKVFMSNPFTITTAFAPANWNYTISAIQSNQPWPHAAGVYGYLGVINFTANPGYEIDPGEIGTFGARLQFNGTVSFCTEQTPIPEPATMVLLGLGGLLSFRRR